MYDEQEKPILIDPFQYEIITFHPEYTNANFIGSILPVTQNNIITYRFIPGPFTKILKRAINNPQTNFYLIIEEINRGNASAIFGDIFNLLDRENNGNGRSIYEISHEFIATEVFNNQDAKIYLPQNLSLIGTMNSSDQNVIALDTAFERRWETIWISDKEQPIDNNYIKGFNLLKWGEFRKIINQTIKSSNSIIQTEDKKLGAYFIDYSYTTNTPTNTKTERLRFTYKVLIYLFENVCKYDRTLLFNEEIHDIDDLVKAIENDANMTKIWNENLTIKLQSRINNQG